MELLHSVLQSVSYLEVFSRLSAMTQTDVVVLFLLSKPIFVAVSLIAVIAQNYRSDRQLESSSASARRLPK